MGPLLSQRPSHGALSGRYRVRFRAGRLAHGEEGKKAKEGDAAVGFVQGEYGLHMSTPVLGCTQHIQPACHPCVQDLGGRLWANKSDGRRFWDRTPWGGVAVLLRAAIVKCGAQATMVLLGSALATLGMSQNARGQVAVPAAAATSAPVIPSAEPPSERVAAVAFARVEAWLRAGTVPERAGEDIGLLPEFVGASLWVRSQGRVVARASLMAPPGEKVPDVLEQVVRGVIDQVGHGFEPGRFPGVDKESWLRAVLGGSTMTLELAGPLVPFRAETYDDVDMGISPGVWGVATAAGRGFDALFPLNMLSTGMMPGAGLRSTIARATEDPSLPLPGVPKGSPGAIAKSHGATYYRFRTVQMTRFAATEEPTALLRGGTVVRKTALTQVDLMAFADRMAEHLLGRLDVKEASEGEVVGVLELREVGAGGAGERMQALVALQALAMYESARRPADGAALEGIVGRAHETLAIATRVLLSDIGTRIKDEEAAPNAIEGALMASWLGTRAEVVGSKEENDRKAAAFLAASVRAAYDPTKDEFDAKIPEPVRGLVALAFVRLSAWEGSGITKDDARKCVRRTFASVTPGRLSAQMPWLGWAELELAGAGEVPSLVALVEMRDELKTRVIGAFDAGDEDADMAGGIMGEGGGVLPSWHTARPGAFLATMLADARLTPPESRARELGPVLDVVRFLRQLAVDDCVALLYGDRNTGVKWGIRSALYDLREPGDATSFSLMAVSETVRAIQGRPATKPQP